MVTASSGAEALAVTTSRAGEIDLLVSDAVMPGMAGLELARQLRVERPELPILFVSGWAGEAFDREWAAAPAVDLLLKPFDVADLLERIQTLLAARSADLEEPRSATGLKLSVACPCCRGAAAATGWPPPYPFVARAAAFAARLPSW